LIEGTDGADTAEGLSTRFGPADVLFGKLRPYLAKVHLADHEGICSGELLVLRPLLLEARFLHYFLLMGDLISAVDASTYGSKMPRANWQFIGNLPVLIPAISEQSLIADFLDRETARIDGLVGDYRQLIKLLNEEVTSLALSSVNWAATEDVRLANTARIVSRPVVQREGEVYTPLGLFNRGRGLFHKDPRPMNDMGDSDFFWIEGGDLLISGQFAWEGAIALAGNEDSGCVVSHRYHVLRGRDGIALTEYLLALLSTKHGDFLLNENSRGAAGRNRPLNINYLLKEKIPVLDLPTQEMVAKAVHRRIRVLSETSKQIGCLQEYRSALISAAVTGQIDVRTYRPQEAAVLCQ